MHLTRRLILVVAASLLWALMVAAGFYRLAGAGSRSRRAEPERPLVVATQPLPLGTIITRDLVKLRNVPEPLFPAGGFSRQEDVLERPVISAIQAGEPVIEARLAARGSGVGLAPLIAPGMRAISVRVNDVVGVAGFILPGMRVDVLVTAHPPGAPDTVTRTVLQNITVLSAGQTIETDGKSRTIPTPVVTLLVNPTQAEVLTLANNEGHIQLVLRNSADQEVARTTGRQLHELFAAPASAPVTPAKITAVAAPRPASAMVRRPDPAPAMVAASPVVPPKPEMAQVTVIRGSVKNLEPVLKGPEAK